MKSSEKAEAILQDFVKGWKSIDLTDLKTEISSISKTSNISGNSDAINKRIEALERTYKDVSSWIVANADFIENIKGGNVGAGLQSSRQASASTFRVTETPPPGQYTSFQPSSTFPSQSGSQMYSSFLGSGTTQNFGASLQSNRQTSSSFGLPSSLPSPPRRSYTFSQRDSNSNIKYFAIPHNDDAYIIYTLPWISPQEGFDKKRITSSIEKGDAGKNYDLNKRGRNFARYSPPDGGPSINKVLAGEPSYDEFLKTLVENE